MVQKRPSKTNLIGVTIAMFVTLLILTPDKFELLFNWICVD